jgi:UDP-glucose 4-epimerase
MILITGGLGFIGSHTARALLDVGEKCVVTQHRAAEVPEFLQAELGDGMVVEALDLEEAGAVRRLGERYSITGVVHLADPAVHRLWRQPGDPSPLCLDGLFDALGEVLIAAADWGTARVTIASTVGVYGGAAPGEWTEDTPLPPVASHAIPLVKRCSELIAGFVGSHLGLEVVVVRPSAIWGPGGRGSSNFFALPALVHAAVGGHAATAGRAAAIYAEDGIDQCYVKDCGRAIAMVQTAPQLRHTIYNVGSGRVTTNAEVVAAICSVVPGFAVELVDGRNPGGSPTGSVDITRLCKDTGYQPRYNTGRAVADYIGWLRAGHGR